eukprot:gnl/Carplike_NY0171/12580_a18199_134.p1 GENE.gnl/Carplike_NY0171/12580_a18199_134~~gnl/Carplike_NY0171/12580_a18199_134.p1  ORF type:complete len:175 (-),score=81.76 gnl/Carplike_NY0171/12580_a18199_134:6-530(-)
MIISPSSSASSSSPSSSSMCVSFVVHGCVSVTFFPAEHKIALCFTSDTISDFIVNSIVSHLSIGVGESVCEMFSSEEKVSKTSLSSIEEGIVVSDGKKEPEGDENAGKTDILTMDEIKLENTDIGDKYADGIVKKEEKEEEKEGEEEEKREKKEKGKKRKKRKKKKEKKKKEGK